MRRLMAVLTASVLSLLLLAGPALAADASEGSGDDDLWRGLIYAAIAGTILGVIAFIDSTTGDNALDDAHGADH